MAYKTFKELNISFQPSSDCVTCNGLSCHNTVDHKNGNEYNIHISTTDEERGFYDITASDNSTTSSEGDILKENLTEEQVVKFICDNFNWFKCF